MRDYRRYATVLAFFATGLYLALVVAALGLISLGTNMDVIPQADAGPLVGPSMVGGAVVTVLVMMLITGVRTPPADQRIAVGFSFLTGVVAYAVYIAVGAVLYTLGTGVLFDLLEFTASMLPSPFALAVGICAFLVTLIYSWILAAHVGEHGRPLWPWERRGE